MTRDSERIPRSHALGVTGLVSELSKINFYLAGKIPRILMGGASITGLSQRELRGSR